MLDRGDPAFQLSDTSRTGWDSNNGIRMSQISRR
ncbi:Uncharacterised protein [Mycobacteroides abscessus subsp. abscessus]|nr:Uncharacterised protein [Mycobacteroides abscessus subsp. abscessus]